MLCTFNLTTVDSAETAECSPRLELSQNRWRTFNAYVLFYQKASQQSQIQPPENEMESDSSLLTLHQRVFQSMPEWLRTEITQDCAHFFKSRDLYSLQHAKMISDVVIETVWEGETADSERDEMAEKIFEVDILFIYFHIYCWTFLFVIQLFDTMCTSDSPDDAWSAWWRLVSHALCSWVDDMESIGKKKSDDANVPIEILRRMTSIISPGGRIRGPLRCLRQFIDVTSSSTVYLFSTGALTVLYDLIVNEWTQKLQRLRSLYCRILNWLYSVHHMDTQLCDSIEDIFCMADQKWPEGEYMKSVVQFILEVISFIQENIFLKIRIVKKWNVYGRFYNNKKHCVAGYNIIYFI
uniref:LINES_N domain-containing protein n=1 Tax=Heterorhabditis bacteriophora TaxID=37862 RepID=A0A1I7WJS9_HETBA